MSETPTPEEAEQSEELLAVVTAVEQALFWLLTDESFTEEEAESLRADLNEVAYLSLDVFDPEVIETSTNDDGSQTFTFQMTVPNGNLSSIMEEKYSYLDDMDWDDDE